ncbi:ABC transporter permease [Aquisphaera insulae]|uniref:ABC transporter permease n=1 Tax=Aquisphaera insulae TaxID=2712864 RepID=UPI0013EC8A44|nr:ABC transporter permease [Aquisphaera insulae]
MSMSTSTTTVGRTAAAAAGATRHGPGPGSRMPVPVELIGRIGQAVVAVPAYFGGLAILVMAAAASLVRGRRRAADAPPFWATMKRELGAILALGGPIIGLVHVGMGSSLSLQAYFGSTFVDGTGAVVGVGLLRNIATMATGMSMAGLLACRYVPGLRGEGRWSAGEGRDRRDAEHLREVAGALVAPRLAAAAIATVLLSFWGFLVGSFIGWQAAREMMGLSTNMYFLMFYRMIWFRDVIGLIVKGLCFGLAVASICCFEGLRGGDEGAGPGESLAVPMARAVCVSMVATLILNMTWFLMVYHAVPVYGPSLLQPPTP